MECSGMNMTITTPSSTLHQLSHSSSSSSSPPSSPAPTPTPPSVIVSPCAACKILRRRCAERCVLAPYFPPTEPAKFTIAHRVFGASNIIKFLQELPESQRADAVSSMVYEASARIRDPIYGCAGAISQLQKQVSELQAQLAKAQAEVVNMKCQQANLLALICMQDMSQTPQASPPHDHHHHQYYSHENLITTTTTSPDQSYQQSNSLSFLDDYNNLGSLMWPEPLWT